MKPPPFAVRVIYCVQDVFLLLLVRYSYSLADVCPFEQRASGLECYTAYFPIYGPVGATGYRNILGCTVSVGTSMYSTVGPIELHELGGSELYASRKVIQIKGH